MIIWLFCKIQRYQFLHDSLSTSFHIHQRNRHTIWSLTDIFLKYMGLRCSASSSAGEPRFDGSLVTAFTSHPELEFGMKLAPDAPKQWNLEKRSHEHSRMWMQWIRIRISSAAKRGSQISSRSFAPYFDPLYTRSQRLNGQIKRVWKIERVEPTVQDSRLKQELWNKMNLTFEFLKLWDQKLRDILLSCVYCQSLLLMCWSLLLIIIGKETLAQLNIETMRINVLSGGILVPSLTSKLTP